MNVLLVKYAEVAIRGKNRYLFENRIIKAIIAIVNAVEAQTYRVKKEQGRILVFNERGGDCDRILEPVRKVLGVYAVCPAVMLAEQPDVEEIKKEALAYINQHYGTEAMTFKVETKRADKRFPLTSHQLSAAIGELVIENTSHTVNVHKPQFTLWVELRNNCYLYAKSLPGYGGLPVGSTGKAVSLLSGGIDSPVATFLSMKRGISVECCYFHSPPYTSEWAKRKVLQLVEVLADYSPDIKLHIVHFTEIQKFLLDHVPLDKLTIFLKRAMLKIAETIAMENRADALITGDSVGQVASQTLMAINAQSSAVSLPILRPLATYDKQEIVDAAIKIGTYDISIQPYEDCCTLFVAKHPETKPKRSVIEKIESSLELDSLLQKAFETREIVQSTSLD